MRSTRTWALVLGLALGACKKEPEPTPTAPTADTSSTTSPTDCAEFDGICRMSCLDEDADCLARPGDGVCVGNAGELCTSDPDCDTRDDVCGNGECSATEDSDICYADCGPTPWLWDDLEADLLARINAARAAGITCPGLAPSGPLPALAWAEPFVAPVRERAWEMAHQGFTGVVACNGRTEVDVVLAAGVSGPNNLWITAWDAPDPDPVTWAFDHWLQSQAICPSLVSPDHTRIGLGVAGEGVRYGFVFIVD